MFGMLLYCYCLYLVSIDLLAKNHIFFSLFSINDFRGLEDISQKLDRLKTWCEKCTPMCASARVAPSNIVYQWYGYRSTRIDVLTTENCFQMLSGDT